MANETVLIVEDEANVRKAMGVALEREGYNILEARDGTEAIETIFGDLPQLILLDIMLPGMNGYDITLRVRDDSRTRDIPIIMVTAKTRVADRLQGLQVGADDYITKPFDLRELVARVNVIFRRTPQMPRDSTETPEGGLRISFRRKPPPGMTFSNFVGGPANTDAFESAKTVARRPGAAYDSLFLYGEATTGKTHLLAAAANRLLKDLGPDHVVFVTSRDLEESIGKAILTEEIPGFVDSFKNLTALAVDDVHFLARDRSEQDKILAVFTHICGLVPQVMVSCDRSPALLGHVSEPLGVLFAKSEAVELHPPSPYHRVRILRIVAERRGWSIPDPSLIYLAKSVPGNLTILFDVTKRVVHEASTTGEPIQHSDIDRLIRRACSTGSNNRW